MSSRQIRNMINSGINLDSMAEYDIISVCYNRKYRDAKLLLEAGANVNLRTIFGQTALMVSRDYEIMKLLIDYGADVNILDIYNKTALYYAVITRNNLKTIELLLYNGADPNLGTNVLLKHLYKTGGKNDIFKNLVDFGADINVLDDNGNNALHTMGVARSHNIEIAQYLISHGVNINHQNKWLDTPLMYACSFCNLILAKFLVDSGANKNLVNEEGNTALYYARHPEECHPTQEIINLFINENELENVEYIPEFLQQDCPICYDTLGENSVKTTCGHYFHKNCLLIWKKQANTCPSCRAPNSFFGHKKSKKSKKKSKKSKKI